jgi:hypothetical protein
MLGPGSYSLQNEFLRETKRVSIAPEPKQKFVEYVPGPGYYEHTKADLIMRKSSPSKKIMPSSASTASFKTNLGPGYYDLSQAKSKAFTIGTKRSFR